MHACSYLTLPYLALPCLALLDMHGIGGFLGALGAPFVTRGGPKVTFKVSSGPPWGHFGVIWWPFWLLVSSRAYPCVLCLCLYVYTLHACVGCSAVILLETFLAWDFSPVGVLAVCRASLVVRRCRVSCCASRASVVLVARRPVLFGVSPLWGVLSQG